MRPGCTLLVTSADTDPGSCQPSSSSRPLMSSLFTWEKLTLKKKLPLIYNKKGNAEQKCWSYSLVLNSACACSLRCSPSPATYCSPRQEEGTSLTSAGSRISVQPSEVANRREKGLTVRSMGIPPSFGSLIIKNKSQTH